MKTLLLSFGITCMAVVSGLAQKTVDAREIMDRLNRKEPVSYQNITITGDLDLTSLANRREVREGAWRGDSHQFLSVVEAPISFKNCTFAGKFLAYRTEDQDGKLLKVGNNVYNTDFNEAVTFDGCTFENDAAFKYSVFSQRAIFTNNTFQDNALFKYSKFRNDVDFGGSTFRDYADFKYTQFSEASSFQRVSFDRYADFKYTKFDERVDFSQARFTSNADFKYTHLPRGTSFDNTRFDGSTDFKYTTLDGRRFSPNSRN